ncbi:hypothetical protein CEP51_006286 [Fusarium floridanum]|uniref:Carboxylic ester hydrolase n=1 Tax=Fusarium floridanum TaxID=1325733 RepID=A0A428RT68_9HYPO|nr:hypothetical protein CEP51_006286 [Fusarium floridanum]
MYNWMEVVVQQAIQHGDTDVTESFQMASNDPDLRPAKRAGVKMITYHALADPGIAPQNSIEYYHKSCDIIGSDEIDDFHRLFLVPGQDHCIAASGVVGSANPPIPTVEEWLDLLVNWVEEDKAPDHIIAHSVDNTVTKPICKYPRLAKYKGREDVNKASRYNYQQIPCKMDKWFNHKPL